jgi:hypothetical protein
MIRLASIVVYVKVCHESPFSKEKEAFLLLTCRGFFILKKTNLLSARKISETLKGQPTG